MSASGHPMGLPVWNAERGACSDRNPYLDWAVATGWQGQAAKPSKLWVPLLAKQGPHWKALLKALEKTSMPSPLNREDATWGVLWVRGDQVARAAEDLPGCEYSQPIEGIPQPGEPLKPPADSPYRDCKVLIGIVDAGGAFLNQVFRDRKDRERTRVVAVWDQALDPSGEWAAAHGGYGRVLHEAQLEVLCGEAEDAQAEAVVYQRLGLPGLVLSDRRNEPDHATHVLDTLAGLPQAPVPAATSKPAEDDSAAAAPLVLVSTPRMPAGQTTGTPLMAQVLDGLNFILAEAEARAAEAVVINVSMGVLGGPHDGSLPLEQALDDLMKRNPHLLIVLAAGNSGTAPPYFNAAGSLSGAAPPSRLVWRLQPQDVTDSFLEIWAHGEAAGKLQLRVAAPFESSWLEKPGDQLDLQVDDRLLGRLVLQDPGPHKGQKRARAQLSLAPSLGPRGGVPAGRWVLELRLDSDDAKDHATVDAWVQGDVPRWTDGETLQSLLDDASGQLALGAGGSLSGLATGEFPLVVAAMRADDETLSPYSSRPASKGQRPLDVWATADEGVLASGLVASGALSGTLQRMAGTSVAAPVAARHWVEVVTRKGIPGTAAGWRGLGGARRALPGDPLKIRP